MHTCAAAAAGGRSDPAQALCAAAGQPGTLAAPLLSRSRQASNGASVTPAPALRGQLLCAGACASFCADQPWCFGYAVLRTSSRTSSHARPALTGIHSSQLPSAAALLELPAVPGCNPRWSSCASSQAAQGPPSLGSTRVHCPPLRPHYCRPRLLPSLELPRFEPRHPHQHCLKSYCQVAPLTGIAR